MKPLNSKNLDFLPRVLYDLSFFVWVGVLLFNILTGLIVDAFGTLRNKENVRESTLTNECFICGFARPVYDEVAGKLVQGPSFDGHNTFEHDLWNYVFFYRHLEVKDSTEFSGVESYVAAMIAEDNLPWLPLRTSLNLQSAGQKAAAITMAVAAWRVAAVAVAWRRWWLRACAASFCAPHAHPLLPTAMAFVSDGFVLVRVRVRRAP